MSLPSTRNMLTWARLTAAGAFPDRAVDAIGASPAGFPRACQDVIGQHLRGSGDVPLLLPDSDGAGDIRLSTART
eukprot:7841603-Pyramimonas_sp.AAC.1